MSFAFVRQSDNSWGTSGGSPVTFAPAAITAGNLVIVSVDAGQNISSVNSVTDSLGNTYTPVAAGALWHTSVAFCARTFFSIASAGGSSPTVTVNFTGTASQFRLVSVAEYSCSGGPAALDGENHAATTSNVTGPANSGSIVTTATDLLYGFGDWAATILSAPAGWTARNASNGTTFDFLNQAASTYSFQPTYSGSQTTFAQIVAFKEASGFGPLLASQRTALIQEMP